MVPIVHGLAKDYGDRITFVRVNVHNPNTRPLQEQLGFGTTPEFYLVDGQDHILGFWDGDVTVQVLRQAFEDVLSE